MAFNDIWGSAKGRSLKRKMTDYMSVIFLGPIILILSSSAAVFLTTSVESIVEQINFLGFLMPIILFLIKLVPFFLVGFLLFLIFVIFPNTTVKLKPAIIAGIVAGVVYQMIQYMWIDGQIYLSTYSVVYGSFAALPLFLIWLQLSWTVVLLGGELTFAIQNAKGWSHDDDKLRMSFKFKRKLTVYVLWKLTTSFRETDGPVPLASIHSDLHIPLRFLRQIITDLEEAKLIVRVVSVTDEELYQPGLDINKISIIMIYNRLDMVGFSEFPTDLEGEGFEDIVKVTEKIEEEMTNSSWNKKLIDL
ncbi:MAG: membrane protein [Parvicella sp.]